jgi:hypothetical protein
MGDGERGLDAWFVYVAGMGEVGVAFAGTGR